MFFFFFLLQKALSRYSLVFDAIYTPKLTRLLREAQESGAIIVYGTEMFINQAFVQFERFTGLPGKMIHKTLNLRSNNLLNFLYSSHILLFLMIIVPFFSCSTKRTDQGSFGEEYIRTCWVSFSLQLALWSSITANSFQFLILCD